jgi:hypothetical protein
MALTCRVEEPSTASDVDQDEFFAPFRKVAHEAGYRSVQSTPLIASDGTRVGMVSTMFASRYVPTKIEMEICKAYCIKSADHLQTLLDRLTFAVKAQQLHDTLYVDIQSRDAKISRDITRAHNVHTNR